MTVWVDRVTQWRTCWEYFSFCPLAHLLGGQMMGWWTGDLALSMLGILFIGLKWGCSFGMLCVLHVLGSDMLFFFRYGINTPMHLDYSIGSSLLLAGISYFTSLCLTGGAGLVRVATCTVMCIFSQTSAAHCFVKVESLGQGAAAPKPVV